MSATHRRGPTGMDEPAGTGRWLATLGRHPWYLAIMAVAAFGLVAGSVTVLVQANSTPSHQAAASNCGLINCGAAVAPVPAATISTQGHIGKAHATVSHAPKPSASPALPPTQGPTHAQASPPNVTLTFTADQDQRDFDHFDGQLTLVNQGGSPVAGWTAELTLPGDEVFSVENQDGRDGFPFDHWQFDGDTLTISAGSSSGTLTPGQPLSLSIHGRGRTTSPTGCTFNGTACPTLRVTQPAPQPRQQFQQPQAQQPATPQDQPSSQSAGQSSSAQTSQAAPSSPQTASSSPQTASSSPQDRQPSPQDQPSQDRPSGRHQRDQRSWPDDRQPSFWGWAFSGWH